MTKMPPLWKVRRELTRPFQQFWELRRTGWSYFGSSRYYDRVLSKEKVVHEGDLGPSGRMAVYVIYPGTGLLASHILALEHLRDHGVTPVVVSNLPLTPADRGQVLRLSRALIERPNYGYDFGAYREGVLYLAEDLSGLDRLILLNDSVWFPMPGSRDWIGDMEALGVDFAGAASHFGTPKADRRRYQSFRWSYSHRHRNFHYASFALSIGPEILRDPAFLDFWKKLPMTSRKKLVVKWGEIGLTQWAIRHGYSHASLLDSGSMPGILGQLDEARLRTIAERIISIEDPTLLGAKHAVLASEPSRADLENLLLFAVARQGAAYTIADFALAEARFPFLKKSPLRLDPESSEITLDLLREHCAPDAPFLSEAREIAADAGYAVTESVS